MTTVDRIEAAMREAQNADMDGLSSGLSNTQICAKVAAGAVAAAVDAERARCLKVIDEWVGPAGLNGAPWYPNMLAALRVAASTTPTDAEAET